MIRSLIICSRLVIVATVVLSAGVFCTGDAGAQDDSLSYGGMWRTFRVHLPAGYDAEQDTLYSLILALHGGFGSAANLENQSQLSTKADTSAHPFVVVYPEGVPSPLGIRTWNAGGCCGYARDNQIDDVGFLSALIDTLKSRFLVDSTRVYVTGMSNGGMMSYRLATELSSRIAAIAPVASTSTAEGPWMPENEVPIIHFHSLLDRSVPIEGGVGTGASRHYNPPVDSVLNAWSDVNGCGEKGLWRYDVPDNHYLRVWENCRAGADIHLFVTYDGGHSWPGGKKTLVGDPASVKVSANDRMWSFFLALQASEQPTRTEEPRLSRLPWIRTIQSYPNPFRHETTITFEIENAVRGEVLIVDMLGRRVKSLHNGLLFSGINRFLWNSRDDLGTRAPAGMYFLRFIPETGPPVTAKMILLN